MKRSSRFPCPQSIFSNDLTGAFSHSSRGEEPTIKVIATRDDQVATHAVSCGNKLRISDKEYCMSHGNHDQFRLGFLTAIEDAERGFVGGLLITNRFGRPLEFQCTAPVKPNRTQQILYGPTLKPYVLCELIGRTLLEKVGVKPHLVLVESLDLLDLRSVTATPVASLVQVDTAATKRNLPEPEGGENAKNGKTGKALPNSLRLGNETVAFDSTHTEDRTELEKFAKLVPVEADLREPFERVREALVETIRLGMARPA